MTYALLESNSINKENPLEYSNVSSFAFNHSLITKNFLYEKNNGLLIYPKKTLEDFIKKYGPNPKIKEELEFDPIPLSTVEYSIHNYYVISLKHPIFTPSLIQDNYRLYALLQ